MKFRETDSWAREVFGHCELGDPRRVSRLIDYASRQARAPESSTLKVCEGDTAAEEGAYRFLRNNHVIASEIDDGVYRHTVQSCKKEEGVILLIQDTTTIDVAHVALREDLQELGCPTGFVVHSALAVAANGNVLGLIDQKRWIRPKLRAGKATRYERPYQEKESFKWENCLNQAKARLGDLSSIITVCDREADIYEFLVRHREEGLRYVIRASLNRRTADKSLLFDKMNDLTLFGERKIRVGQRGTSRQESKTRPARAAREVKLIIRGGTLSVLAPTSRAKGNLPVTVNVILVEETDTPQGVEPLVWRLFTSEPISTLKEAQVVVDYYEKRWLIEEFHKCWKTGCRIEERALQSLEALNRFYAVSAPIAVRLLQLRGLSTNAPDSSCETILERDEWMCLFARTSPKKPLPKVPPSTHWAYYAIAKLGGWIDTKRTGRVGWKTMWDGWNILAQHVSGWRLARSAYRLA